ncbi:hypothetical protein PFISCL1PPCAC_9203, partial [Pristionchus fissidentatus]
RLSSLAPGVFVDGSRPPACPTISHLHYLRRQREGPGLCIPRPAFSRPFPLCPPHSDLRLRVQVRRVVLLRQHGANSCRAPHRLHPRLVRGAAAAPTARLARQLPQPQPQQLRPTGGRGRRGNGLRYPVQSLSLPLLHSLLSSPHHIFNMASVQTKPTQAASVAGAGPVDGAKSANDDTVRFLHAPLRPQAHSITSTNKTKTKLKREQAVFLIYLYLPLTNGAEYCYTKYVDPAVTKFDSWFANQE